MSWSSHSCSRPWRPQTLGGRAEPAAKSWTTRPSHPRSRRSCSTRASCGGYRHQRRDLRRECNPHRRRGRTPSRAEEVAKSVYGVKKAKILMIKEQRPFLPGTSGQRPLHRTTGGAYDTAKQEPKSKSSQKKMTFMDILKQDHDKVSGACSSRSKRTRKERTAKNCCRPSNRAPGTPGTGGEILLPGAGAERGQRRQGARIA